MIFSHSTGNELKAFYSVHFLLFYLTQNRAIFRIKLSAEYKFEDSLKTKKKICLTHCVNRITEKIKINAAHFKSVSQNPPEAMKVSSSLVLIFSHKNLRSRGLLEKNNYSTSSKVSRQYNVRVKYMGNIMLRLVKALLEFQIQRPNTLILSS